MLKQCCTVFSLLNRSKRFCSRTSEFLPLTARGIKMKAEINWIIPNIMAKTYYIGKNLNVNHNSPKFFDEKDDKLQWCLQITSQGVYNDNLILRVWGTQQQQSSIATKQAVVVSDEKEGQHRQLIFEKTTHSTEIFGLFGGIAQSFKIGSLEELKKLSTVSVRCTVEYDTFDLKESDNKPSKLTESPIIDVDKISTGLIQQYLQQLSNAASSSVVYCSDSWRADFENLFTNQIGSDICFIIAGQEIRAHKIILSARSPVFSAMFNSDMMEKGMDRITIPEIAPDVFNALLRFIYTDQVQLTESNAELLLIAANQYLLPSLNYKCEQFIIKHLMTAENCVEMLTLADLHNALNLKKKSEELFCSCHNEMRKTEAWKTLKSLRPDLAFDVVERLLDLYHDI